MQFLLGTGDFTSQIPWPVHMLISFQLTSLSSLLVTSEAVQLASKVKHKEKLFKEFISRFPCSPFVFNFKDLSLFTNWYSIKTDFSYWLIVSLINIKIYAKLTSFVCCLPVWHFECTKMVFYTFGNFTVSCSFFFSSIVVFISLKYVDFDFV